MPGPADADRLLDELTAIVSEAGGAIAAVSRGSLNTRAKDDKSPVTAADHAANDIILARLAVLLPALTVISEETAERPVLAPGEDFILVDPLDGTREFLAGRDEFTVNIAIISGGHPVVGVIGAPALGSIWRGAAGRGAERLELAPGVPLRRDTMRRSIRTRGWPQCPVATVSVSHPDPETDAFLGRLGELERISCGSSVKFCRVAEGTADLYPRFGRTCEWDIAAGHAILAASGGAVRKPDGDPLRYGVGADGFFVPGFIAVGDPSRLPWLIGGGSR